MNLSDKPLSAACESVLKKGLSFVPTTDCNEFDTIIDFQKFFRSIRLREFFKSNTIDSPNQTASTSQNETHETTNKFRGKSRFIPPQHRNASIDTYCRLVERDVRNTLKNKKEYKVYNNLSREEREALNNLSKDTSLIVKNADKGGAIVVLNRSDYEKEVYRQLGDDKYYKKLSGNPTSTFKSDIHHQLKRLWDNGHLTKKEHDFLKIEHPTTPCFYCLPKVHKDPIHPKGRPIVAAIGSLTENISSYVDFFLQPFVKSLPSFTQDSTDLIKTLKSIQDPSTVTYMACLDVESLYTSIPHTGALEALTLFLNQRTPESKPETHVLIELTETLLTHNHFIFQDDNYLQIKGVSMGSKASPSIANIYMGLFEQNYVFNPTINMFLPHLKMFKRYIDDICILWTSDEESLLKFFEFLNSKDEHLKFTIEYDKFRVNFLDIQIKLENGMFQTDVYRKPCYRNSLLKSDSFHPTPLKNSLPISQFYRIRRICSTDGAYQEQSKVLSNMFHTRGYPVNIIEAAAKKVSDKTQDDCLVPKARTTETQPLLCVTQYSPLGNVFKKIIKKHWFLLNSDPTLDKVFKIPPRLVYRRAPNIRDIVVQSDLRPVKPHSFLDDLPDGNRRCGSCAQCHFTEKCNFFYHPSTGQKVKIRGKITCTSTHVIYLLRCPCGKAYVGKTSRALKTRISEHRSTIRNGDEKSPVALHFKKAHHNVSALRYLGIEKIQFPRRGGDIENLLLKRELWWINYLKTMAPIGLNEEFDIRPYL